MSYTTVHRCNRQSPPQLRRGGLTWRLGDKHQACPLRNPERTNSDVVRNRIIDTDRLSTCPLTPVSCSESGFHKAPTLKYTRPWCSESRYPDTQIPYRTVIMNSARPQSRASEEAPRAYKKRAYGHSCLVSRPTVAGAGHSLTCVGL